MAALIHSATPGDARAIASIHVESWREAYGGGLLPARYLRSLSERTLAQSWARRIADRSGERSVWVASDRGEIEGFVEAGPCLEDDALVGFAGEVTMLYLRPSLIGGGLGRALFEHALSSLELAPFYWAVVWVLRDNTRARRFYRQAGFRPDGARRLDRFTGRDVPVVRYAGPLNPATDYSTLLTRESCPP
jgi:ribosomal protein S18 acetylase RimI-like enzyme